MDDSLIDQQINEYEDKEHYSNKYSDKRQNDWHYALHNYRLLREKFGEKFLKHFKPLHYYTKTKPEFYYQRRNKTNNKGKHRNAYGNYSPSKNWSVADKRKIQSGENQLTELFDNE